MLERTDRREAGDPGEGEKGVEMARAWKRWVSGGKSTCNFWPWA
jgi:hypothetical protein